jgi:predicted ATP-grasp superfamily ATP-dependent carboligase
MSFQDTSALIGIISASITTIIILGKWLVVIPLKSFIVEHTYPIQPTANGGKSLPDVAKAAIAIQVSLDGLNHQVERIERRLDTHIEQHVKGEA